MQSLFQTVGLDCRNLQGGKVVDGPELQDLIEDLLGEVKLNGPRGDDTEFFDELEVVNCGIWDGNGVGVILNNHAQCLHTLFTTCITLDRTHHPIILAVQSKTSILGLGYEFGKIPVFPHLCDQPGGGDALHDLPAPAGGFVPQVQKCPLSNSVLKIMDSITVAVFN